MATYFECKARYDRVQENGSTRKVKESYLVDALSCTEAEARLTDVLAAYVSGDMAVTSVRESAVSEVVGEPGGNVWIAKVDFPLVDEKTGAEKKAVSQIAVWADDFDSACEKIRESLKDSVADWRIEAVSMSAVADIVEAK